MIDPDAAALRSWFGRFVTRYRSVHEAMPAARPLSPAQLQASLRSAIVMRNPWSRAAWSRSGRRAQLFVAGTEHACSLAMARLLAGQREIAGRALLRAAAAGDIAVLTELVNAGHLVLVSKS